MVSTKARRMAPVFWLVGFITLSSIWLWAPLLNHQLSYRVSLISQYEAPGQPYAWLLRLGDLLGASLLLIIPLTLRARKKLSLGFWLLLIFAVGSFLDPIFSTTCHMVGDTCREYSSPSFIFHALESSITAAAILALGLRDYLTRKKLVSALFCLFQFGYGLLFISQVASDDRFNTASQYTYQLVVVLWVAWYVRENYLRLPSSTTSTKRAKIAKNFFGAWALINGFLAILLSLAHIHLLGRIRGLYFAGDSAWLAQHGVIIGVVMIYISRQLARGERRARQVFLVIVAIEAFKYSVISPQPLLLALYLTTFLALFLAGPSFNRGPTNLSWEIRFKDAGFFLCALLAVVVLAFTLLDSDERKAVITNQSLHHFFDYTVRTNPAAQTYRRSALLAHTGSAFIVAGAGGLLFVLFRPQSIKRRLPGKAEPKIGQLLRQYSTSSEDYFKLWPVDKNYFQAKDVEGFIAYKINGPVALGLADPIAANQIKKQKILAEFINVYRGQGLKVCFLPISQNSLKLYKKAGLNELQIGASALIDINNFLQITSRDKWWRWQTNRAKKAGYQYSRSLPPHSEHLLKQMESVSEDWLSHGGRKERSFALGHFDRWYLNQTPVDYLIDSSGAMVAFTNQPPIFNPASTITVDLLRHTHAAQGAMPYLLLKSIENVKHEADFQYFDLGFVPFARARGPIMAIARALGTGRFSSRGLEQFKNKFDPIWQPMFMAYDGDWADLALIAVNLESAMDMPETA